MQVSNIARINTGIINNFIVYFNEGRKLNDKLDH